MKKIGRMVPLLVSISLSFAVGVSAYAAPALAANGQPSLRAAVSSSHPVSRQRSLSEQFEQFRSYGIVYDSQLDQVLYNGQPVKAFVDFHSNGEPYAFNIGYFDKNLDDSALFLVTVKGEGGKVVGIAPMPDALKAELYDVYTDADSQKATGTPKDALKELYASGVQAPSSFVPASGADVNYVTFDATTTIAGGITVTDLLDPAEQRPQELTDWLSGNPDLGAAFVKRTVLEDGSADFWICCNSGKRLSWTVEAQGNTIRFNLLDRFSSQEETLTLLRCKAPGSYTEIEVLSGNQKLPVTMQ